MPWYVSLLRVFVVVQDGLVPLWGASLSASASEALVLVPARVGGECYIFYHWQHCASGTLDKISVLGSVCTSASLE